MGIYIYTLIGKRDVKGAEVFKAKFSQRLSNVGMDSWGERTKEERTREKQFNRFDKEPLFVFNFNNLEKVYKKVDCHGYFYDCDSFGEHYGWLMKIGRAYQVITVTQLDAHINRTTAFKTFAHLIEETGSYYRPTIRARDDYMNVVLADIFDDYYNERGPWIDPETNKAGMCRAWDKKTNSAWKAQTQAYRG